MVAVAHALANGSGVERNLAKAVEWYQAAAADDEEDDEGDDEGDSATAADSNANLSPGQAAQAAERKQGHPDAQFALGVMLSEGVGVDAPDLAQAVEWLERAGEQGHAEALFTLGVMHQQGRGSVVERDIKRAADLYAQAADEGSAQAHSHLGMLFAAGMGVPQSWEKAVQHYRKAAEAGAILLCDLAPYVWQGLLLNRLRFRCAGVAEAQFNLAGLYAEGQGVEKDEKLAYEWVSKAVAQGALSLAAVLCSLSGYSLSRVQLQTACQRNLLRANRPGIACSRARAPIELSAAIMAQGSMLLSGAGCAKDEKQGIALLTRAAAKGEPHAMLELANCYEQGRGVPKSASVAKQWRAKGEALEAERRAALMAAGVTLPTDSDSAHSSVSSGASAGDSKAAAGSKDAL